MANDQVYKLVDDSQLALAAGTPLDNSIEDYTVVGEDFDEAGKKFTDKYGQKFPFIRKDDQIARFYNYQRGDVIKITRNDGFITYRIVKG